MKKLILAATALSAFATSLVVTPAQAGAALAGPEGLLCAYTATSAPTSGVSVGEVTGDIDVGPALTTEPGTLVCTIQVGASTHDGPDAGTREFVSDANGLIVGVRTVSQSTAEHAQSYLCTSFRKADGTTIYWTGGDNPRWHSDTAQPCAAATQDGTQDNCCTVIAAFMCAILISFGSTGPQNTYHIDAEGDVIVDGNANGIRESEATKEMVHDCPVYTFTIHDDSNPDQIDGGVID